MDSRWIGEMGDRQWDDRDERGIFWCLVERRVSKSNTRERSAQTTSRGEGIATVSKSFDILEAEREGGTDYLRGGPHSRK